MSKYTTGEIAKLCGVTVRTVQYYDTRGILVPSETSEGGRRLYSDADLRRMKIICFLRECGLPINSIGSLLSESDPALVISALAQEQENQLRGEIRRAQEQLEKLDGIMREVRRIDSFSVESIGDIAQVMANREKMRRVRAVLLLTGIPLMAVQWGCVILWIVSGKCWPFFAYTALAVPYGVWVTRYFFRRTAYICPQCHDTFRPSLREAFWARHTPTLRKLTCTCCGHNGFCVETYCSGESEKQ